MTINFIVRVNKNKDPRIVIVRAIKDRTGKRKRFETVGTLPEDLSQSLKLFENNLDDFEQFQLENFIKNIQFNIKNFNNFADDTQRELIYFSPVFHQALYDLWKLAKKNQLDFTPYEVMLNAILNKAKAVERQLNEKSKKPVKILESIGLDIHRFDKDEINKRLHTGSQSLFKALIDSKKPLEDIAQQFNNLAEKYNKKSDLKPHYISEYAAKPKRLSLWYSAIAIELLLEMGLNPLDVLSLESVINAWLTLKKGKLSASDATDLFLKTFKPSVDKNIVANLINQRYHEN